MIKLYKKIRSPFLVSLLLFSFTLNSTAQKISLLEAHYLPPKKLSRILQSPTTVSYTDSLPGDTLVIKKRFWRAAGELMLAQVIPWSFNYFVRDAEFAHISWESIKYNMDFDNWVWDDNKFTTNQFAHPYHGSLYFSAFRTNGYNFWQSAPAALVGSYMWEVAGETHPAAPNDLINTTLGGISLGEMTFRASNLIVDNRQTGFKRQANEVLAFLVSPMNGLNRIIDGRWGHVMGNPADRRPSMLSGELDMGWRRFSQDIEDVFTKGDNEFFTRLNLMYGDPFEDVSKPFSNFSLLVEAGAADSAFLNVVVVNGSLYSNNLKENEFVHKIFNVTMNYDYYRNNVIQYGGQSFDFKILTDHKYGEKSHIFTTAGVTAVVLGSVPDDYLLYGEGRNYDFGPGAGFLLGAQLNVANRIYYNIHAKGIWFHTVNGTNSDFFLNLLTSEFRYATPKNLSFGAQIGYFTQNGYYADYADVEKHYPFVRLFLGYKIGTRE